MRDNIWLKNRLNEIWALFFSDVTKQNSIIVKFKGKWKNKFGHIKRLKDGSSEIVVNGLFKDEKIPEYIVDLTIAHELVHYLHGFSSPYERKYQYPHKHGVVRKELIKRGFKVPLKLEKRFVKQEWRAICKEFL